MNLFTFYSKKQVYTVNGDNVISDAERCGATRYYQILSEIVENAAGNKDDRSSIGK